jgi:hypothetical protein
MSIQATINSAFSALLAGLAGNYSWNSGAASIPNLSRNYTDGTGAAKANKVYAAYRTLTTGTNEELDLTSGALKDAEQTGLAFTGLKEVIIAVVSPDGTKKLTIGNATANSFQGPLSSGGTVDVHYSENWTKPDAPGYVVNSSNRYLKIANPGAATVNYFILLIGI